MFYRSGVGQTEIQTLYDYIVKALLSHHFLSGADKQSTYGFIVKKRSHVSLSVCEEGAVSSDEASMDSYVTAASFPESRRSSKTLSFVEQRPRHRYHMLIYKSEQTYLAMFLNGEYLLCIVCFSISF